MNKLKIMSIFGTRPEAIKMAPLIKELEKNELIESIVCVTAQHRQMLDQVLEVFKITPTIDLNIMKQKQSLVDITINSLKGLNETIIEFKPDMVLVHGDTSTTFAGALAAFYAGAKVGHVEAGLRTYDKYQPYPEEINRVLTTSLADLNFAPTVESKNNLLKENVNEETIFVTGNTGIDSIFYTVKKDYKFKNDLLNSLNFDKKLITMTAHRRENIGKPLENICSAILDIVNQHEDVEVVYAVHLNPVVRETVDKILGNNEKVHLVDPLDIEDMHNLINKSYLVLTDSGGLQEEVPSMKKPVVVLRNVTERPEGVTAGTLKLAGTDVMAIKSIVNELLVNHEEYGKMINKKNPFGDGHASKRIVESILYYFKLQNDRPKDYI